MPNFILHGSVCKTLQVLFICQHKDGSIQMQWKPDEFALSTFLYPIIVEFFRELKLSKRQINCLMSHQ